MSNIGIQNNNPGNIRHVDTVKFQGETAPRSGFKSFQSMPYGYRAMIKNLQAYILQGKDTIDEMIHTWAPWGDGNNNPDSYAKKVSDRTGIPENTVIDYHDIDSLEKIAGAISQTEIGTVYWDDLKKGANMVRQGSDGTVLQTVNVTAKKDRPGLLLSYLGLYFIGKNVNKKYGDKSIFK